MIHVRRFETCEEVTLFRVILTVASTTVVANVKLLKFVTVSIAFVFEIIGVFVIEAVFVVDVVAVVVKTIVVTTSDGVVVLVDTTVVTTGNGVVENIFDIAIDVAVDMSVLSVVAKIRSPTYSKQ